MLVRSRFIRHPSGTTFRTPLLLPSFSSKGLGFTAVGRSELRDVFAIAAQYLTDAMLVSAYDVHHDHLPRLQSAIASITFVDSGGYETTDFQDLSAAFVQHTVKKEWSEARLKETLDGWSERVPAVFVSHDRHAPIARQINAARRLLRQYPKQLGAILLKPGTKRGQRLSISDIASHAGDLAAFDVIGVTEKELGSSMIERMEAIAKIRLALDDAKVDRPIHVFGSLDPITVPLYFVSGAEIFDGLTWLRYGYREGAALYQQNCAARQVGVHHTDAEIRILSLQQNLLALSDLAQQLHRFADRRNFDILGLNASVVRSAYELLRIRNARVAA